MKDWYLRQTPRDRVIVLGVAALCILGLLYAFVWYPLQTGLQRTEQAIVSKQDTLAFIRRGTAQLQASGGSSQSINKTSDKAPWLLIDEILRNTGLEKPDRLEQSGSNGARVSYGKVEFDKLITALAELELYGLQISTMTVSRRDEQGIVSAKFNMERS